MKSNNKTNIILLACALIAGGAGWYLSTRYISTEVASYKANFDAERKAVPVVVAEVDLNVGDVVSTTNASVREIPKSYVTGDSVAPNDFSSILEGRQIVHPVRRGDPILGMNVSQVKVNGLASLLKPGERAISIPVTTLDTISGFLNPGDFIDLMVTMKDSDQKRTVPLAQNLRVLATGSDLDDGVPEKTRGRIQEITLGVTPLVASRVIHAQTVGDIAVLLRKPEDDNSEFKEYVTIDNLVDIPVQRKAQPVPQPKQHEWGFELIKGGKRS